MCKCEGRSYDYKGWHFTKAGWSSWWRFKGLQTSSWWLGGDVNVGDIATSGLMGGFVYFTYSELSVRHWSSQGRSRTYHSHGQVGTKYHKYHRSGGAGWHTACEPDYGAYGKVGSLQYRAGEEDNDWSQKKCLWGGRWTSGSRSATVMSRRSEQISSIPCIHYIGNSITSTKFKQVISKRVIDIHIYYICYLS